MFKIPICNPALQYYSSIWIFGKVAAIEAPFSERFSSARWLSILEVLVMAELQRVAWELGTLKHQKQNLVYHHFLDEHCHEMSLSENRPPKLIVYHQLFLYCVPFYIAIWGVYLIFRQTPMGVTPSSLPLSPLSSLTWWTVAWRSFTQWVGWSKDWNQKHPETIAFTVQNNGTLYIVNL